MEKSSLGELPVLQAKISGKTTRQTATRLLAGRDDDDDVFGRGLVSFHTPPVSRLLFCGPLPYSVSRERMNGDEFGQHKEEEEEYFLAPFFLSFLLMARKTGATAGLERENIFFL